MAMDAGQSDRMEVSTILFNTFTSKYFANHMSDSDTCFCKVHSKPSSLSGDAGSVM
jgi:hypothetical protein